MKWIFGLFIILTAVQAWVRLAPGDPADWHVMPEAITNRDFEGGAMRVTGAGDNGLARMDKIIMGTARTKRFSGDVESGMVTYVTRSMLFGFPDYTTIRLNGPQIEIFGRLRFGKSDFGVNAGRIDRWLGTMAQGG